MKILWKMQNLPTFTPMTVIKQFHGGVVFLRRESMGIFEDDFNLVHIKLIR